MLQVVRDLRSFSGDEDGFRSWVFTIAHRRMIDARRSNGRRPADPTPAEAIEPALTPVVAESEALHHLATDEILALLDRLTPDQREVLVLRVVVGLRGSEIAEITGRDVEAVKGLARRGIDRLRQLLDASAPVPTDTPVDPATPHAAGER